MKNHFFILKTLICILSLLTGSISVFADANPDKRNCSVNSIHDGDTLRVTCEGAMIKVRLYCIDTPELAQRPWGGESRDHLRSLVGGNVVLLDHGKDRYGRVLGEVLFQGENVNITMVQDGQAAVYVKYCSLDRYYMAEKSARESGLGIWSKPGMHQTPWAWRKKNR
jgi:endonuclease YncB( thermonuclease family)